MYYIHVYRSGNLIPNVEMSPKRVVLTLVKLHLLNFYTMKLKPLAYCRRFQYFSNKTILTQYSSYFRSYSHSKFKTTVRACWNLPKTTIYSQNLPKNNQLVETSKIHQKLRLYFFSNLVYLACKRCIEACSHHLDFYLI